MKFAIANSENNTVCISLSYLDKGEFTKNALVARELLLEVHCILTDPAIIWARKDGTWLDIDLDD